MSVHNHGLDHCPERLVGDCMAVIDPGDREQVERLRLLYLDTNLGDATDDMQAALREFASPTPPKPDEPQGLGAVVEDADGVRWVRVDNKAGLPSCWQASNRAISQPQWSRYASINAVRVLSEGVTND